MDLFPTSWVAVDACTLPTVDQPLRAAEFDALFATSLRAVERPTATRARLVLAGDDGLRDRVRRLADAETECCSFFTFSITSLAEFLVLDVEVPAAHTHVLAALLDRAARVHGAAA